MVMALTACISIPMPSGGPKLEKISLPVAGDEAATVRQTFGEPQRLDVSTYWVYEWTTDRKFVVVPVMPMGMPVGAAVAGNQYRMLVQVGPEGRIGHVACTAREAPEDGVPSLECETPIEPLRANARKLFTYQLDRNPELVKIKFFQSQATGASTAMVLSPTGRLLAATDSKNRLWVVDTESGEIVYRHVGEPIKFYSMSPTGQVNAGFSLDGERLFVSQRKVGAEILDRNSDGTFEAIIELGDDDLRQIAVGGEVDTIVALGELGVVTLQPDGDRSTAVEPLARLDFDVHGPEQVEPRVGLADLVAVRLGQSWWTGGRTAVFRADGRGIAILDLRNNYARVGKQGYRFSLDGRWLAHNTGRHFEIWPSAELLGIVEGRTAADAAVPSWVALMPFTNRKDEEVNGHMPIAFRDDGGLVAAASRVAIHVWRVDDGEPVALIGALAWRFHQPSGEYSIEQASPDDWAVLRVLALALAPDNRLTAVLADSSFNVFVGAWQIEGSSTLTTNGGDPELFVQRDQRARPLGGESQRRDRDLGRLSDESRPPVEEAGVR